MIEYIMNEETLEELVEGSIRGIFESHIRNEEVKKKFWDEIFDVLNAKTTSDKWAKFVSSKVFEYTIGDWEKIDGVCLWVND